MIKWKKLLAAVLMVSCGVLCAESLLEVTEQVSMWIDKNWTHARTRQLANKQCDAIVLGQGTDEEKIAKLKEKFPGAFQKEEKPLIFTPQVSWRIHSLALGYDIKESATQTARTVDIFKDVSSSKTTQDSSTRDDITRLHKVNVDINGGTKLSANPFSWLAAIFNTKINLAGSYSYGRDSVSQTTELWSKSQQAVFSQERSRIAEMIQQTNISNFHLTFTVTVTNNGGETVFCDLSDAYLPVYGERAYNQKATPYAMPKMLEIPSQRTKDITFRMELDNTNARELAVYMASNSPQIDILKGGNLRIMTKSGKDAIGAAIERTKTNVVMLNLPGFTSVWNIRRNHTSTGNFTTLREALDVISKDFENALGKYNIFQYKEGNLSTISSIPLGEFDKTDKDFRYIAFLQSGDKVYDKVSAELLNANLPADGCTIWVIDLDDLEKYKNINPDMQKLIYGKISKAASDGFLGLEKGNPAAQYRLARMYRDGFYVKKDIKEVVKWYRKAAEQGNPLGQTALGVYYMDGIGVEKDVSEAVKWLRRSAEQGNPIGQAFLGACYMDGIGVEKDVSEAVKWLRKSAEQGNPIGQAALGACYMYGNGVEKNYYKAVEWYRKAAEQGEAVAQCELGMCYYYGNGVEKNYYKAVEWYRKAAEQGDAGAQYELGMCYYYGNGVEKNYYKAVEWYQKAAEQGNAEALYLLGECYHKGRGVEKNIETAKYYYQQAAEKLEDLE